MTYVISHIIQYTLQNTTYRTSYTVDPTVCRKLYGIRCTVYRMHLPVALYYTSQYTVYLTPYGMLYRNLTVRIFRYILPDMYSSKPCWLGDGRRHSSLSALSSLFSSLMPPKCHLPVMMWCDVFWWDAMWYDVFWWDAMWYDVMWYDMVWHDVMWGDVFLYDAMLRDVMRCGVLSCDVMWCD
jgi:hypothetical protein